MSKKIPTRVCVGCRQMRTKDELVRVVRTPQGEISVDKTGKVNGRGAYICKNPECLEKAVKNRGLERTLRAHIPENILCKLSLQEDLNGKGENN